MRHTFIRFKNVSYSYPGSVNPVVSSLSFNLDSGWTTFAGANGCGKTTVLRLATKQLTPDAGSVSSSGKAVYCAQRTDSPPWNLDQFLLDWSSEAIMLRSTLKIQDDWGNRWNTLSHGERKRLQTATAIWSEPDVLAMDEPFNHLDTYGRSLLAESMKQYRGCGLLVTHDRNAMDRLCSSCVLFFPESINLYRTGYTSAVKADREKREHLVKSRRKAEDKYRRLKQDARRKMLKARTIQAHTSGNNVSFRDICRFNYDGPSRVDGIVQKAGQRSREATVRAHNALEYMESITYRKIHNSGIQLAGENSSGNFLLNTWSETISTGNMKLECPCLEIGTGDRIAVTGRNGSGKTTLLNHLKSKLCCPEEKVIWIPQEVTAAESTSCLNEARQLSGQELGHVMTIVRRLGSDPGRILESSVPSPGETRKLLLALGLSKSPWLVVMDEPANHMDLPSVECLEKALIEYTGALLLVSHDSKFLASTTTSHWHISRGRLVTEYHGNNTEA